MSERFGKVENGSAYGRAAVDLGTAKKVLLPIDAEVRRTAEGGKVQLFMKKTLGFGEYPRAAMSTRDARKNMGGAVKAEVDSLVVSRRNQEELSP